ncbi:MAG: peptidase [Actinomycetales bacterium]|nr:peptidase [Actinomycetales bacterium]
MPNARTLPDLSTLLRLVRGREPAADTPHWAIIDLHGSYPTHHAHDLLESLLERTESFQSLTERLEQLARLDDVTGVLVRVVNLTAGLATCAAIGRALGRLQAKTRVVVYLPQVSMRSLLVAAGVREVVAPESAEVMLPGLAAERVYYGEFLTRRGIGVENLRIREYKTALTRFSDDHMDEHEREQLSTYLASAERSWLAAVARDAGAAGDVLDARFTSAAQLLAAGLITRIAYDDEIAVPVDQDWSRSLELVRSQFARKRQAKKQDGIAVVPVVGAIVSGRSRPTPPVPLLAGPTAGSETVVAALRKAERDEHVKAVVLYVDSGGGSALASDVIGRAVARSTKPVVAVMGEVAASGGYYVLVQARHVVASAFTITGSIGVVVGKPVLRDLNARIGRNPEAVGREAALFGSANTPFSDADRAWAERMMEEVYARFVTRVAAGRGLSRERVDELGRGRIWSGADALERGLVDELGDLHAGIVAARRLAGLPDDAPVRSVSTGFALPGVPSFGRDPVGALVGAAWPFGEERVLTWYDPVVTIR